MDKYSFPLPKHLMKLYTQQHYSPFFPSAPPLPEMDGLASTRKDLTHHTIYTIDPEGCEDADDGFSISENSLYVHIADPTTYFTASSQTFTDIMNNGVTQYPSLNKPHHMCPRPVVTQASLMNGHKPALTIQYDFDMDSEKLINIEHYFSYIMCMPETQLTYEEASKRINTDKIIKQALHFCEFLSKERTKNYGELRNHSFSTIVVDKEKLGSYKSKVLHNPPLTIQTPTIETKCMKRMIAEFAISTNTYIAHHIADNSDFILMRTCNDDPLVSSGANLEELSAEDILSHIVKNGVRAQYDNKKEAHKLVGSELYTHSTSPLRRSNDILVHFILKKIWALSKIKENPNHAKTKAIISLINNQITPDFIAQNTDKLNTKSKKMRNIDILHHKYRFYQFLSQHTKKEPVTITYRFLSYSGLFVNIMIEKINDHSVYFSYCIRVKPKHYTGPKESGEPENITITKCFVPKAKFDSGSLPELESKFIK